MSIEIQKMLEMHWNDVEVKCKVDRDKIHHVVIMVKTRMEEEVGYKFVHNHNLLTDQSKAMAHLVWWFIRQEALEADLDQSTGIVNKSRKTSTTKSGREDVQNMEL